jgi:hypothetical protein
MDESYNGWTNYPTWAVALWLSNDPGTAEDVERLTAEWDTRTRAEGGTISQLADGLRVYVESLADVEAVPASSLASDLLGFALDKTDWHRLAESFAHDLLAGHVPGELERRRAIALDTA